MCATGCLAFTTTTSQSAARAVQDEQADNTDWAAVIKADGAATDVDIACRETLLSTLACIETLLSCSALAKPELLPTLLRTLATFAGAAVAAPALDLSRASWHASLCAPRLTALCEVVEAAFQHFRGLARGHVGVLEQELVLLRILKAVTAVPRHVLVGCGVTDVGVLEHLPEMQRTVRRTLSAPARATRACLGQAHSCKGVS